jgi:AcrR family transcriptional regulator
MTAALTVVRRSGTGVPMATIAAQANVGIGTLYRHFGGRDHLLDALTTRSFELVLAAAQASDRAELTGRECIRVFFAATVTHCEQLVLPLHGGPGKLSTQARRIRKRVHSALHAIVERGIADHSLRTDVTTWDIIGFGALLAQPLAVADWKSTAARLAEVYLEGLRPRTD